MTEKRKNPMQHTEIARLGGMAVARNRAHMSNPGKRGGASVSRDREHMVRIGRAGGHKVSVETMAEIDKREGKK